MTLIVLTKSKVYIYFNATLFFIINTIRLITNLTTLSDTTNNKFNNIKMYIIIE